RNNPDIHTENGFEVPVTPGVVLYHILTVNLGAGTLDHVVNGVGEAEDADLGVFGAGENPVIYLKGERYKTTSNADAASDILALVEEHFIN
ncbi:MAG TPA: hypothetical protein PK245_06405, partial [Clostridia bacterium]|nr:hypothetical protein [Clostridia bacterium]